MDTLRLGCVNDLPFMNVCKNQTNLCWNCHKTDEPGIDFEIIYELLKLSLPNFKNIIISMRQYQSFGDGSANGSGFVGGLGADEVDVAIPIMIVTQQRISSVEFLLPLGLFTKNTFLVNPVSVRPLPPSLFKVFDLPTWILGLTTLFLMSLTVAFITQFDTLIGVVSPGCQNTRTPIQYIPSLLFVSNRAQNYNRRMTIVDAMFGMVFQKRQAQKWSRYQNRLLITVWSSTSIMGLCMFSGIYVKGFTPAIGKLPFSTSEQLGILLQNKWYKLIVSNSGVYGAWMKLDSDYKQWESLRHSSKTNQPIFVRNLKAAYLKVKESKSTVMPVPQITAAAYIKKTPNLVNIEDKTDESITLMSYGVNKRHKVLASNLSSAFVALTETGILFRILRKYGIGLDRDVIIKEKLKRQTLMKLNFMHIESAITALILGLLVATFVFIFEAIYRS